LIDIVVHRFIFENNQITLYPCFTLPQKMWDYPLPKTRVSIYCVPIPSLKKISMKNRPVRRSFTEMMFIIFKSGFSFFNENGHLNRKLVIKA